MTTASLAHPTLAAALWPSSGKGAWVRGAVLAVAGSLLLTLSAKVQVPFWPVPMTMQTFAVLVIAMVYGPRLGMATILFYLVQGAAGLPVFAGTPERGLGLAYMAGPTGGYLIGFALATLLMGRLAQLGWDRTLPRALGSMVAGTAVIFICGALWLGGLIGYDKAFAAGVLPFLPGEALKIALGCAVMPLAWKLVGSRG